MISVDRPEQVMTISDYNALAKLYGQETYSLNDDEYIVIGNYEYSVDMRNIPLKNGEQITSFASSPKKTSGLIKGCLLKKSFNIRIRSFASPTDLFSLGESDFFSIIISG